WRSSSVRSSRRGSPAATQRTAPSNGASSATPFTPPPVIQARRRLKEEDDAHPAHSADRARRPSHRGLCRGRQLIETGRAGRERHRIVAGEPAEQAWLRHSRFPDFPESELLAYLYAGAMRARGVNVTIHDNIGERGAYLAALRDGSIGVVPEYSGALLDWLD